MRHITKKMFVVYNSLQENYHNNILNSTYTSTFKVKAPLDEQTNKQREIKYTRLGNIYDY